MKFVIQRVNNADVTVDNKIVGSIGKGFLILFGACETDTADMLPKFVDKIVKLRIFADENGKTNLSITDVGGELLIVSQFTLYADCRKGNPQALYMPVHLTQPTNCMKNLLNYAANAYQKLKQAFSVLI